MIEPVDDRRLYELVRRHLLREAAFFAAASPSSSALRLPGVFGSVVPAAPDRSILNWVVYERLESLVRGHDGLAAAYKRAGVRAWAVWTDAGDAGAAAEMKARGYKLDAEPLAMAAEMSALTLPDAGDLTWSMTRDIRLVARINDAAYGLPPPAFEAALEQWPPSGSRWFACRADLRGSPASVLMFDLSDQGDCGVTSVATLPEAQGRGLATRLLASALREARALGAVTTTLQASALGSGIYRSLGYRDLGAMGMWEWREPDAGPAFGPPPGRTARAGRAGSAGPTA
jgi:GNAT superfamily N-acetyltransferase